MSQSTRFPLLEDFELRSATEDKDSVVSNIFYDKEEESLYAVKRPGLTSYITGSGQGNGIFGWNDMVFSFYGQTLILDTFSNIGMLFDPNGHISDNGIHWRSPLTNPPNIFVDVGVVENYTRAGGIYSAGYIGFGAYAQVVNPISRGYIKATIEIDLGTFSSSGSARFSIGWKKDDTLGNMVDEVLFRLSIAHDTTATVNFWTFTNGIVATASVPPLPFGVPFDIELDISETLVNLYMTDVATGIKTSYLIYTPTVDLTGFYPVFLSSLTGIPAVPFVPGYISYFEAGTLKATHT